MLHTNAIAEMKETF